MTKRELINEIVATNRSAEPEFLAQFADSDLRDYLQHLQELRKPKLEGNPSRYDRYWRNCPTIPSPPNGRRAVSRLYTPVPTDQIPDEPDPRETPDAEPVEMWADPQPAQVAEKTQQPEEEDPQAVSLELDDGEYVSDVSSRPAKPEPAPPVKDQTPSPAERAAVAAEPTSQPGSASESESSVPQETVEAETWLF